MPLTNLCLASPRIPRPPQDQRSHSQKRRICPNGEGDGGTGIRDGCNDGARRELFPRERGTQISPTVWPMVGQVAEVVCPHWTAARPLQKPIGRGTESGGRKGWAWTRWRGGSRAGRRAPSRPAEPDDAASSPSIGARPRTLATVRDLVPGRASSRPVPSPSPRIRVRCCQERAESADSPVPAGFVSRPVRGAAGKALGLRSREGHSPAPRRRELGRHSSSAAAWRAATVDWPLERLPTQPMGRRRRELHQLPEQKWPKAGSQLSVPNEGASLA